MASVELDRLILAALVELPLEKRMFRYIRDFILKANPDTEWITIESRLQVLRCTGQIGFNRTERVWEIKQNGESK